jgi:hypothetical protein
MDKEIQKVEDFKKYPSIHGIIVDLRIVVDDLNDRFKKFQEIILELARRLDEEKICKRDIICQLIKEILKDKMAEGKISERWIETCLPIEYKRRHNRKKIVETEVPAVSQKNNQSTSLIQKDKSNNNSYSINLENPHNELKSHNNKLKKGLPKLYDPEFEGCSLCKDVIIKNKELKEIAEKSITFLSAERLNNGIKIPKDRIKEIEQESKQCKDFLCLIFDVEGNIIRIKADIDIDNNAQKNIIPQIL